MSHLAFKWGIWLSNLTSLLRYGIGLTFRTMCNDLDPDKVDLLVYSRRPCELVSGDFDKYFTDKMITDHFCKYFIDNMITDHIYQVLEI